MVTRCFPPSTFLYLYCFLFFRSWMVARRSPISKPGANSTLTLSFIRPHEHFSFEKGYYELPVLPNHGRPHNIPRAICERRMRQSLECKGGKLCSIIHCGDNFELLRHEYQEKYIVRNRITPYIVLFPLSLSLHRSSFFDVFSLFLILSLFLPLTLALLPCP